VKDLGDPLKPDFDAPVRALYPNHTAEYIPLGVVNGTLYLKTDLGAPHKKIVGVAIDKPDAGNWRTVVPDSKDVIESAAMVAGKIVVNRLVGVARADAFNHPHACA